MIVKDQLTEGEKSPSTTELASFYKINHITVGKGVNQLVDKGILYKKRGIGMFVAEGAKKKLLQQRKKQFVENYIQPLIEEADKLGLSDSEIKDFIQQEKEKWIKWTQS